MQQAKNLEKEIIIEMKNILRELYLFANKKIREIYLDNDRLRESGQDYITRSKNLAKIAEYETLKKEFENEAKNLKLSPQWLTWSNYDYIKKRGIRDFLTINGGEIYFR